MAILVDYRCTDCGGRAEHRLPSPPPATVPCIACGAESRRLFAPVGLSGGTSAAPGSPATSGTASSSEGAPSFARGGRAATLCAQYPQIPGLCHMSESAGRMWVAKYTGNARAVDREQERQEKKAAVVAPTMADAIGHHHASG